MFCIVIMTHLYSYWWFATFKQDWFYHRPAQNQTKVHESFGFNKRQVSFIVYVNWITMLLQECVNDMYFVKSKTRNVYYRIFSRQTLTYTYHLKILKNQTILSYAKERIRILARVIQENLHMPRPLFMRFYEIL